MPVIIVGMHRSGTSMITRLLHKCGLYLGEADAIMVPNPEDNPDGYWEHSALSQLNDEILGYFGGSWQRPPKLEPGWSKDAALQTFWQRFEDITASFSAHGLWGWKDPRNSVTLEFWLAHIPDLKVILCLRNPLEVADSLSTGKLMRDMERTAALDLWDVYHRAILAQDIESRLIVTHYDSYLYDPDAELRRILAALDVQASNAQIEDALDTIRPDSKHQRVPDAFVGDGPVAAGIHGTYEMLCLRAGEVFGRLRGDTDYLLNSTVSYARGLRATVTALREKVDQQNREFADFKRAAEAQRQAIADGLEREHKMLAELETNLALVTKRVSIAAELGTTALQGFKYRRLQLSRVMAVAEKLRNFWSIRKVTRAIHSGQLKIPALFDADWYLKQYPDVKKAGIHPYAHFWLFGWYQQCRPMPLFDIHWYVTNYPYFNDEWANPLEHYESRGQFNGCRPCAQFDPQWYLSQYPDVRETGLDPLYHYSHFGLHEGRRPAPESGLLPQSQQG